MHKHKGFFVISIRKEKKFFLISFLLLFLFLQSRGQPEIPVVIRPYTWRNQILPIMETENLGTSYLSTSHWPTCLPSRTHSSLSLSLYFSLLKTRTHFTRQRNDYVSNSGKTVDAIPLPIGSLVGPNPMPPPTIPHWAPPTRNGTTRFRQPILYLRCRVIFLPRVLHTCRVFPSLL